MLYKNKTIYSHDILIYSKMKKIEIFKKTVQKVASQNWTKKMSNSGSAGGLWKVKKSKISLSRIKINIYIIGLI